MKSGNSRKKYRIRKGRVAAAVILLAALIGVIVFACSKLIKKHNHRGVIDTTYYNNTQTTPEGEFLQINFADCNMYIGATYTLKCISYPDTYAQNVTWSSTNEDAVVVNDAGMIIVRGTGIAAITATSGIYSDSVIINGISKENPSVDSYMPVIEVVDGSTVAVTIDSAEQSTEERITTTEYVPSFDMTTEHSQLNTTENNSTIPVTTTSPIRPTEESTTTEVATTNHTIEQSTTVAVTTPAQTTQAPTTQTPTTQAPTTQTPTTQAPTTQAPTEPYTTASDGDNPTKELRQLLLNAGFTQYLADTYVYIEDGNCLGEIIVTERYFQCYLMTRTRGFDAAYQEVLKNYLKTSYSGVYSRFVTANDNQTFVTDGHMVRIVAADKKKGSLPQLCVFFA